DLRRTAGHGVDLVEAARRHRKEVRAVRRPRQARVILGEVGESLERAAGDVYPPYVERHAMRLGLSRREQPEQRREQAAASRARPRLDAVGRRRERDRLAVRRDTRREQGAEAHAGSERWLW